MSEPRVRPAREADAAAVRRFVPAPLDWPTTVSALGALVAVDGEEVVGVVVRWPHPGHVLVELLAVAPLARRAGAGTALLDAVELEAIGAGVNAVRARPGGGQDPFLRRSGFVPAADGRWLEKRLAP